MPADRTLTDAELAQRLLGSPEEVKWAMDFAAHRDLLTPPMRRRLEAVWESVRSIDGRAPAWSKPQMGAFVELLWSYGEFAEEVSCVVQDDGRELWIDDPRAYRRRISRAKGLAAIPRVDPR